MQSPANTVSAFDVRQSCEAPLEVEASGRLTDAGYENPSYYARPGSAFAVRQSCEAPFEGYGGTPPTRYTYAPACSRCGREVEACRARLGALTCSSCKAGEVA